jgi:xanthine phosphoribosyltransferase
MKQMEEKMWQECKILPGSVLKVSSFLNHQLDTKFIMELGREFARLFSAEKPNKILTIEASGIAIAFAAGAAMNIPVVFAKKHKTSNVSGETYQSVVHSYTHNVDYNVIVESEYLRPGDRVLLIDDFLANGKAMEGLLDIISQAGAETVGVGVAIEKGYQDGGARLRAKGIRVEALAVISYMDDNGILFD